MRKIKIITVAAVMLSFGLPAGEVRANQIVTGRSDPEFDVQAVQEAVAKGGEVLLKGSFDFGPKGQVIIKTDVSVSGESDPQGRPLTTIKGGFWNFYSPLPSTELPLPGTGPKIKIKGIHFDGVTWSPMHFPYTSGAEIIGNKITHVMPASLPIKWQGGDHVLVQTGVILGTRFAHKAKFLPGVSGKIVVENNEIDLECDNPNMTMAHGAFFPWTWGATIEVKGNKFRNVSRNSIESLDNYLDDTGNGSIIISGNDIVTPTEGCPFPGAMTYPSGIVFGWFFDRTGGVDPAKYSKIIIGKNIIQANGKLSTGISSMSDGVLIMDNKIELKGGPDSKGITQLGSNGRIVRNSISGSGAWALAAIPFEEFKASGNTFEWNDVAAFTAVKADFYCKGNSNTWIGPECKIVDAGEDNKMMAKK